METNTSSFAKRWQLIWASLGGILLVNGVIAKYAFADTGVNSALCGIASLLFLLPPMLKIIYDDIRFKRTHMNELVLIAVVAGASRGDFLTAGAIAFFMLIGLIIETRSASGAKESLEQLTKMTELKARRLLNGAEEEVAPEFLNIDDIIRVRPGETVPADGIITNGISSLQEANITGESIPVDKTVGEQVFAGTINLTGVIDVAVKKIGKNTTLGRVKELILAAEKTKPQFMGMLEQYAKFYTPIVLITAFFVWTVTEHDMDRVVTILVAACPIALVLSAPSAAVAVLSAGARLGILIKQISDIESLSSITAFVFDKTGTLTSGKLDVTQLAPVKTSDNVTLLTLAASAEQHSNHPVAKAVVQLGQKVNIPFNNNVTDMHEEPGRGIRCQIDGDAIAVGNLKWMEENNVDCSQFLDFSSEQESGMSMLFVSRNNTALGWISLEDKLRNSAKNCIKELRDVGMQYIALVTGDRKGVAKKVAAELELKNYYAECVPAEKVQKVNAIKGKGYKTVFVGDGVNDAPALAASDIGIAMGAAGSDVAIEAATIALMNNELNRLPFLIYLARFYKQIMIQNFCIGAFFIICGMTAGALGQLPAALAACLQIVSAILVVVNSARMIRAGENLTTEEE